MVQGVAECFIPCYNRTKAAERRHTHVMENAQYMAQKRLRLDGLREEYALLPPDCRLNTAQTGIERHAPGQMRHAVIENGGCFLC